VGGKETDMAEFGRSLSLVRGLFAGAAAERDAIAGARHNGGG